MGYRHSNRSALFLGDPFYYADEGSDGGTGQPGPAIVVVQAPPAAAPEAPQEPRGQPMIIELQGDRYVKLDKDAVAKRVIATPQAPVKPASKKIGAAKAAKQTQPVSANVVLVFRDGHREEIRDYTIADDVLYARSDSSSSGEQTKKIQISALNVPATQAANQAHGKQFLLPAGPNQVVTTF